MGSGSNRKGLESFPVELSTCKGNQFYSFSVCCYENTMLLLFQTCHAERTAWNFGSLASSSTVYWEPPFSWASAKKSSYLFNCWAGFEWHSLWTQTPLLLNTHCKFTNLEIWFLSRPRSQVSYSLTFQLVGRMGLFGFLIVMQFPHCHAFCHAASCNGPNAFWSQTIPCNSSDHVHCICFHVHHCKCTMVYHVHHFLFQGSHGETFRKKTQFQNSGGQLDHLQIPACQYSGTTDFPAFSGGRGFHLLGGLFVVRDICALALG